MNLTIFKTSRYRVFYVSWFSNYNMYSFFQNQLLCVNIPIHLTNLLSLRFFPYFSISTNKKCHQRGWLLICWTVHKLIFHTQLILLSYFKKIRKKGLHFMNRNMIHEMAYYSCSARIFDDVRVKIILFQYWCIVLSDELPHTVIVPILYLLFIVAAVTSS